MTGKIEIVSAAAIGVERIIRATIVRATGRTGQVTKSDPGLAMMTPIGAGVCKTTAMTTWAGTELATAAVAVGA